MQSSPLPVIKQPRSQPRVLKPSVPPDWATGYLASLVDYLDVLQPDARRKYLSWLKKYRRDAAAIKPQACGNGTTHRIRLVSGTLHGELRLSMRDFTPEMINIIALGFVVSIGTDGSLTPLGSAILPSSPFGYNRCALATFVNTHPGGVLDHRLPQLLAVGSDLDADDIPPIVSMSPNHKGATEHFTSQDGIIADEVARG